MGLIENMIHCRCVRHMLSIVVSLNRPESKILTMGYVTTHRPFACTIPGALIPHDTIRHYTVPLQKTGLARHVLLYIIQ